jgi:hypothetical protein
MKTLSDMVGHNRDPEANNPLDGRTDFMAMRMTQPRESLTEKLLHTAEYERGVTDHLIRGLVERLPKPDGIWALDDRVKWLRTATGIFDLVYKTDGDERREISIAFIKQAAVDAL